MDGTSIAAHVLFGTLAFGIGITLDLVLTATARTRRVETIRLVYGATAKYVRLVGPLYLLTILLGVYIALERHESLHSTWLLATYGFLLIGIVFNAAVIRRRTRAILKAVRAATGAVSSIQKIVRI